MSYRCMCFSVDISSVVISFRDTDDTLVSVIIDIGIVDSYILKKDLLLDYYYEHCESLQMYGDQVR